MASVAFFGNGTTTMNTTEDFDFFCVKLFVAPLVYSVFGVPCACVGVPASVWLLWVLIQRQCSSSGSSNNVYMLNLTFLDLIYNIFKLPDILNVLIWHDVQYSTATFFFQGLNFFGRPFFMACSCVDCYMAVVHPIRYMKISKSRYRLAVCALVCVLTLLLSLLLCFRYLRKIPIWYSPSVLAISIIAFCDIAILRTLRKPDPSGRNDIHPQKQRALQTITNSFVMTLVSYLPTLLVQMVTGVIPLSWQEMYCYIHIPSMMSSMLGSTILPLLYLSNLGSFNSVMAFNCISSLIINQKH